MVENKLDKGAQCDLLLDMSKKDFLVIPLALVVTLVLLAMMLPAIPTKTKKHSTKFHTVNSISSVTFTLTNKTATNQLPVPKP